MESLRDRIGIDIGSRMPVEEGLDWAARHDVRYVDFQLDKGRNAVTQFDEARCAAIRETCAARDIHLGLHTLSAVNIAEYSPFLSEATDAYLRAYVDVGAMLGAEWIVVHAGYHFTSDVEPRIQASIARLKRASAYAEEKGQILLLENMNFEPETAEVHYLGQTLDQCRRYFSELTSPALKWAFTVNHAHIEPEGIDGFIDALPLSRCEEVRIADNRGDREEHLPIGAGNIDFKAMFDRIEGAGFRGHYINAFVSLDAMLEGREKLVAIAEGRG